MLLLLDFDTAVDELVVVASVLASELQPANARPVAANKMTPNA